MVNIHFYFWVSRYFEYKFLPVIVAWMFRFSINKYLGLSGNHGNNMSCMNVGTTTRERNRGQCSSCVEQPNDNDKKKQHWTQSSNRSVQHMLQQQKLRIYQLICDVHNRERQSNVKK